MTRRTTTFLSVLLIATASVSAGEPLMLDVWPGDVPGEKGDVGAEQVLPPRDGERQVIRLTNVTRPTIAVYRPAKEKDTGAAVLICPGGGFHVLAMDLEGTEVAEWFSSIGVTAIVLKYRVPARKDRPKLEAPLQDAQRAMSLVRSNAKAWDIDPDRIGILGFSAGGELSAAAATHYDKRVYEFIDEIDKLSCRPNFAVLVYPGGLLNKEGDGLDPTLAVDKNSPPMFFAHAGNDRVSPLGSLYLYEALKRAEVPAELHIYASGGHGFGMRPEGTPVSTWPASCQVWLRDQGLLGGEAARP